MMRYNKLVEILSQNQEKIVWILLINSISLWLLTIATTHIFEYPPDALYYAKQLPVFYWAGMVFNVIAFLFLLGNSTLSQKKKLVHPPIFYYNTDFVHFWYTLFYLPKPKNS